MTVPSRALLFFILASCVCFASLAFSQTETATISGRVTDPSGAVVSGAEVELQSIERGTVQQARSNEAGIYTFPSVQPGQYHMTIQKAGFKKVDFVGLIANVQDHIEKNFQLQVGSLSESITVSGGAPLVNTEDGAVSTVVDRQFAENLPMNGRSFNTLIDITPGVVLTPAGQGDGGQFSVNGQRASSNYWMLDGVGANIAGTTGFGGQQAAGALGSVSVFGGTNGLVSIDAMQEFRIQTSTFAPEFGRTPGAQISIVTRSGTNQFHGSAFNYLRNDVFDANNWFNGVNILNPKPLPKAQERQNDFGGTFSGPLLRNKTFFFFSYEGLRLRLPITFIGVTPDVNARQNAKPELRPYFNAYPLDPNQPDLGNGLARLDKSFSNPASLDAYSIRVDHKLNEKLNLFGRFNYSPSSSAERGDGGNALSERHIGYINTQTSTVGATWTLSSRVADEFRFNYSRVNSRGNHTTDNFEGAVPLSSANLPAPYTVQTAHIGFRINTGENGTGWNIGTSVRNIQKQYNFVDNFSLQEGRHGLKFGVDYRRLSPTRSPYPYGQDALFRSVADAEQGNLFFSIISGYVTNELLFRNLGIFAQDTWRVLPYLTLTYGVRWDTDFPPSTLIGPNIPALTGYNLNDLSRLALAGPGTPPFQTTYGNVAPRIGLAYEISRSQRWGTVARGGFGLFYDLASTETGNLVLYSHGYPFSGTKLNGGGTFPLDAATAAPQPVAPPTAANPGTIAAFAPNLKLPRTMQWNVALEQGLGTTQSVSATYIGSHGERLITPFQISNPNPAFNNAFLVANGGFSNYGALQIQFKRRLSAGLQILSGYTLAHSIDTGSGSSFAVGSNTGTVGNINQQRGDSDFDIRNAFSTAFTYAIPATKSSHVLNSVTRGWSVQAVLQVHSASPVSLLDGNLSGFANGIQQDIRPDVLTGVPLYLHGSQYPGGKAINNTAGAAGLCSDGTASVGPFCAVPVDANGNALRQGTLGRNALRGFGLTQLDFAVHRDFPIYESVNLQFRAEAFNILNHPNFGPPVADIRATDFGLSTSMLGQALSGGIQGTGTLNPLYQLGGPRSLQFGLKLSF